MNNCNHTTYTSAESKFIHNTNTEPYPTLSPKPEPNLHTGLKHTLDENNNRKTQATWIPKTLPRIDPIRTPLQTYTTQLLNSDKQPGTDHKGITSSCIYFKANIKAADWSRKNPPQAATETESESATPSDRDGEVMMRGMMREGEGADSELVIMLVRY